MGMGGVPRAKEEQMLYHLNNMHNRGEEADRGKLAQGMHMHAQHE